MRILGVDPGTRIAGYGVVDFNVNSLDAIKGIAAGAWRLDATLPLSARLGQLALEFRRVLSVYSPQVLCVELAFVAENARSALFLGHARGVVLAEAHLHGLVVHEISATSAKKMITNYGRADKHLVARTLSALLGQDFCNLPLDASDALGIAYAQALRERQRISLSSPNDMPNKVSTEANSSGSNADLLKIWSSALKNKNRKNKKGFESLLHK